ncbi:MAG: helix-turn-helix domain-containing protein [Bacteroidia bacterium]|nr:helix-turn-helix domain-containing protein [Bacteroidia bacterium]
MDNTQDTPNPSYFSILTAEVRYDKALSPSEKLLWSEVSSYLNINGVCTLSDEEIARHFQVEPRTVGRWLNNLEKQGYLYRKLHFYENTKKVEKREIILVTTRSSVGIPPVKKEQKPEQPIEKREEKEFNQINNIEDLFYYWHKNKQGKPYKNKKTYNVALEKLRKYSKNDFPTAKQIIEKSISCCYVGFFAPDDNKFNKNNNLDKPVRPNNHYDKSDSYADKAYKAMVKYVGKESLTLKERARDYMDLIHSIPLSKSYNDSYGYDDLDPLTLLESYINDYLLDWKDRPRQEKLFDLDAVFDIKVPYKLYPIGEIPVDDRVEMTGKGFRDFIAIYLKMGGFWRLVKCIDYSKVNNYSRANSKYEEDADGFI